MKGEQTYKANMLLPLKVIFCGSWISARSLERSLEFHCGWVHPLYEDISTLSGSLEARTLCAPAHTSNREALQLTAVLIV